MHQPAAMTVLMLEGLCYCGAASSAVIVWRLAIMSNLSWVNKMFLLYFTIDCIFGILETYFLFKLHTERYFYPLVVMIRYLR